MARDDRTRGDDIEDARLDALAEAILENRDVDWTSLGEADPELVEQLRVLADLSNVHRAPATVAVTPVPARHPTPIAHWGPLALLERIGEGAFSEVFRAWDTRLEREVAVKLLRLSEHEGPEAPSASPREGRLLARVQHPNIVTVYGAERIVRAPRHRDHSFHRIVITCSTPS